MRLAALSLLAFACAPVILAAPSQDAAESTEFTGVQIITRDRITRTNATVVAEVLEYRTCPRIESDCPVEGQYTQGDKVVVVCTTVDDTTPVDNDNGWALLVSNFYVPLVGLTWEGLIFPC